MIQYAILDPKTGLYFRNTGYGGRWSKAPKLFMRRSDVSCCFNGRVQGWKYLGIAPVIIPMTVKPL